MSCPFLERDTVIRVHATIADVPTATFNELTEAARHNAVEAARGDLWGALSKHIEYEDVWVQKPSAVGEALPLEAKVRVPQSQRDTLVGSLCLYIADHGAFSGVISVIKQEIPAARPFHNSKNSKVDDRPVEDKPHAPASRMPPPEDKNSYQAMLSPNFEQHRRFCREVENSLWVDRPHKDRPAGGFRVNDLLIASMPYTSRHHSPERRERISREEYYEELEHRNQRREARRRAPHRRRDADQEHTGRHDDRAVRRRSSARRDEYVDADVDDHRGRSRATERRSTTNRDSSVHLRYDPYGQPSPRAANPRQRSYYADDAQHECLPGARRMYDSYDTRGRQSESPAASRRAPSTSSRAVSRGRY